MARFAKKRPLLLMVLLLVCTVALINCGQGSSRSVPTPTPISTPTPKPIICASCITVGEPSLKTLGQSTNSLQSINGIQSTNGMQYQLSFVITNNGEVTLSNFEVDLKIDAQTATTTDSNSQTITNSTTVSGHSQFTYQVGDPNVADSGISLPNPPPSSVHMKITIVQNGTTPASWDGQVNVPA